MNLYAITMSPHVSIKNCFRIFSASYLIAFTAGIFSSNIRVEAAVQDSSSTGASDTGSFWYISDIHWDSQYSVHGDSKHMCHEFPEPFPTALKNGKYGDFSCDAPWDLVNSSVQTMHQLAPNPDFIIWTGDNSAHLYNPTPSWDDIFGALRKVSQLLRSSFPSVPIIPVIGNHDTDPPDVLPPNTNIYEHYLLKSGWDQLLPKSAKLTFQHGGYYSISVKPGLQVVGLNTLLWWQRNKLVANLSDPSGQFQWLEGVLQDAKENKSKVYLTGHVPPGFYARVLPGREQVVYYPKFNEQYIKLVNKFKDVITGQFFGHQHYDTFMLFEDEKDEEVTNSILLGPSVTPWHNTYNNVNNLSVPANPGVRLFTYNRIDTRLLNYHAYFLNLTKANEDTAASNEPEENHSDQSSKISWELLYSFKNAYNLPDVSTASLAKLYSHLLRDTDTFHMYINFTTSAKSWGPCVDFCRLSHLCSIRYISEDGYFRCLNETHSENIYRRRTTSGDASNAGLAPWELVAICVIPIAIVASVIYLVSRRYSGFSVFRRRRDSSIQYTLAA